MSVISIRETLESQERYFLHERAFLSINATRDLPEDRDVIRTDFMRDRDRIVHCKAFRRLKHKTQVFFSPHGDHYRTRLTHTLEVSQIARTISKALILNEDLTEAIALGHDLGHTPFGHVGEDVLNKKSKNGFKHWSQSLRVVNVLENNGAGLNLTNQVKDGILKHSKGKGDILANDKLLPGTLEGQVVRVADIIAYVNHDIDDAIRASIISGDSIPKDVKYVLGDSHSKRISMLVRSVIEETKRLNYSVISMDSNTMEALIKLRDFLYDVVYFSDFVLEQATKAKKIVSELFDYFLNHVYKIKKKYSENDEMVVIDYISGMTDSYALKLYNEIFIPRPWGVM